MHQPRFKERRLSQDKDGSYSYDGENDDGQLSETSNEDNMQLMQQQHRDQVHQSSSEMTYTQNEDTAERHDDNTSELSSQMSPSNASPPKVEEKHRNNPLFRSDAFDQIPSQNYQLMS